MKQKMENYTEQDKWVWNTLFERQFKNLQNKSSSIYLDCLNNLSEVLNPNDIPDFNKINGWFESLTGWRIEVVKGLIPVEDFFILLADKKFSASTWLRNKSSLDYIEEPDMFHDVFGHIPLLSNSLFSSFAHEFGKLGRSFIGNKEATLALQRLYWFTIEFGLIREDKIRVYGAGIISSVGETENALSPNMTHLNFDPEKILNKEFRTDIIQTEYVVIESFEQLFDSILEASKFLNKKAPGFRNGVLTRL